MRIGLNLLHAMPEIGGAWNYILRLVAALAECDRENTYVAFVTARSAEAVPTEVRFERVAVRIDAASRLQRVLYENTLLQAMARRHHLDVMHWFANTVALVNAVPGLATVYDLMVYENSASHSAMKRAYLRAFLPYTARHAALLLPMSETTAVALGRLMAVPRDRLVVIPAVVGPSFRPRGAEEALAFRRKYRLADRFWLYVAHFYTHKNHQRLLRAYGELKQAGQAMWPLVLRGDDHGAEEAAHRLVAELGLQDDVRFLPRLGEQELPALYSAATASIFPSLFEGGGIPVLEAMACGCPVAASDIAAVRECGADAVESFDPLSVASMSTTMVEFQRNADKRLECRQRGLERVRDYRGEVVVAKLVQAYRTAAQLR